MNINLNSSAEEIMAYLTVRGKIQLLNGDFVSVLWVPSHLSQKAKKFMNDNFDKWSHEKEHQDQETFDFYEAMRRMIAGEALEWSEMGYIYFVAGSRFMFRTNGERPHELAPLNINATHFKHGRWSVYKGQPKTFGWDEAYRLMKEGKTVRRNKWLNDEYFIYIERGCFFLRASIAEPAKDFYDISLDDLEAKDWCVYEG